MIGPLIQYGLRLMIMRRTAERKDYAVTAFICLCTSPLPSVVVSGSANSRERNMLMPCSVLFERRLNEVESYGWSGAWVWLIKKSS